MDTIKDTVVRALGAGLSTDEVLSLVRARHPGCRTTRACVSHYRSQLKCRPAEAPTRRVDDPLLRDLRRILKWTVVLTPDDRLYVARVRPTPEGIADVARRYPGSVVLNTLAEQEALVLTQKLAKA